MLMLSNLMKFNLIDENGRKARLADLAVAILEKADYPPVTKLFCRNDEGKLVGIGWHEAVQIDRRKRTIAVRDLNSGEVLSDENRKDVLLFRDVLDATILDLQNRRSTRANDLWLDFEEKQFVLRGADVGLRAIIRRLSGGRWAKPIENEMYDWRYVEFLRGDANAVRNGAGYNLRVSRLAPGEIAGLIDGLPYLHAAELIALLPDALAAEVFQVTSAEKQIQIMDELEERQIFDIISRLPPESAAQVLKPLAPERAKRILEAIPKNKSEKILEILRYPDGSVGSIMSNEIAFVPKNITVTEARELLSKRLRTPNFVYFIYAVETDDSRQLSGVMSLRSLVTANGDDKIEDVMDAYVSFLSPLEPAYSASFRLIDSHLAAMPVVNNKGKLLGVLTIDAAVSAVAPRSWRDQAPRVFS
jgi:magnesium transporter